MIWKDYSKFKGTHAFCGASKTAWRNYDIDKLIGVKINSYAAEIGTLLHAYCEENIRKRFKMQKGDKRGVLRYLVVEKGIPEIAIDIERLFPNIMNYVNDAIGFRMDPEVILYYSPDFYGTTDAIFWDGKILRISDLKTGIGRVGFEQLENYAAFFVLDYKIDLRSIKKIEFRIYQNGEIIYAEPPVEEVLRPLLSRIIEFDKALASVEGR